MTDDQGGGGNGGSTPSSGPSWAAIGGILVGVAAVITAIVAFLGLFIDNDGDGSATTVVAVHFCLFVFMCVSLLESTTANVELNFEFRLSNSKIENEDDINTGGHWAYRWLVEHITPC